MIAYIKGTLIDFFEENIVVESGNIGYNIKVSTNLIQMLPSLGSEIKIYTYTHVREDAFLLFGFLTKDDLDIFRKCITVSGIGPKGGLAILSVLDADSLRFAILSGDAKAIAKAPGVGAKTAERLILELKDKVKIEDTFISSQGSPSNGFPQAEESLAKKEALEALVSLGYSSSEALKAIGKIEGIKDLDSETILKAALKNMF